MLRIAIAALLLLTIPAIQAQQKLNPAIEAKVTALLSHMTLEEKAGQMAQVSIESLGSNKGQVFSFNEKMTDAVVNYKIGSVLNTPGSLQTAADWNRLITELNNAAQKTKVENSGTVRAG